MSLWRLGWCACQVWLGRRLTMDCKCLGFVVTQEKSRKTSPKLLGVYQKKQVDTISRAHCWNTLRCVVFIRGIWATTSTHLLLSRSLLSQSHRTSLCQHWESPEWLSGGRTLPKNLEKIQVNQGSNRTCTIYWAVHVGFGGVVPPQNTHGIWKSALWTRNSSSSKLWLNPGAPNIQIQYPRWRYSPIRTIKLYAYGLCKGVFPPPTIAGYKGSGFLHFMYLKFLGGLVVALLQPVDYTASFSAVRYRRRSYETCCWIEVDHSDLGDAKSCLEMERIHPPRTFGWHLVMGFKHVSKGK